MKYDSGIVRLNLRTITIKSWFKEKSLSVLNIGDQ